MQEVINVYIYIYLARKSDAGGGHSVHHACVIPIPWVRSISKQLVVASQAACLIQNAHTSTPTEQSAQHHLTTWQWMCTATTVLHGSGSVELLSSYCVEY